MVLLLLLSLALLATGCGSKKETPTIQALPTARTPDEWAGRIVNRLLRPMNRDIEILLALNNPQTKIFIQERIQTTIGIVNRRMRDLGKCSDRLDTIGPPPQTAPDKRQLNRIEASLDRACLHYVKVSQIVLDAVRLMSSLNSDDHEVGVKKLPEAVPDARAGAAAYDRAVMIAQGLGEFRRQGVKPPP
jgi:hypothetical protein